MANERPPIRLTRALLVTLVLVAALYFIIPEQPSAQPILPVASAR